MHVAVERSRAVRRRFVSGALPKTCPSKPAPDLAETPQTRQEAPQSDSTGWADPRAVEPVDRRSWRFCPRSARGGAGPPTRRFSLDQVSSRPPGQGQDSRSCRVETAGIGQRDTRAGRGKAGRMQEPPRAERPPRQKVHRPGRGALAGELGAEHVGHGGGPAEPGGGGIPPRGAKSGCSHTRVEQFSQGTFSENIFRGPARNFRESFDVGQVRQFLPQGFTKDSRNIRPRIQIRPAGGAEKGPWRPARHEKIRWTPTRRKTRWRTR